MEYIYQPASSGIRLFTDLIGKKISPSPHWYSAQNRTKFALRSALMPISTLKLLNQIVNTPFYLDILKKQPCLPSKLHRPYLSINFNRGQTLRAINEHYQLLFTGLNKSIINKIFCSSAYPLAVINGKNGTYTIFIDSMDCFNKEGELALFISTEDNKTLAKCAFTLLTIAGKKTLFIGGLQGSKEDATLDIIRHATKDCYGLFPKRLLLESVCRFAAHFGCQQILAASNDTHIYKSLRYWHKKKDKLVADYDTFWESLGGEKKKNKDFHLPLSIERKSLEDIASKKRAEYRRRYQLLDELDNEMRDSLSSN
ncbi:VirK/YbjX family protein [Photorhabdus heterorhabditis]|uniref:DUF535 domain-containing protein n=1 Tax=Photorhabdus heterorhabditis TaxID=880156 RepID=A0A5B0WGP0_9GAMM|nr:VirK/YbjX family protein [Photorhabdus heterorhabditis]KAA1186036.1 DUF535 domain-containing protein [Photorhabdus heterorhabditis]